jgi:signal peptidase I
VVVFRQPSRPGVDYIKRLIGLPGDTVRVSDGIVFINEQEVPRRRVKDFVETQPNGKEKVIPRFKETLPNGVSYYVLEEREDNGLDDTPLYRVPDKHYFFLGDNRDNSQDSRVLTAVGFVPEENLVGRAEVVFFSVGGSFWKVWEWFSTLRGERFWEDIHDSGN